MARSPAKYVVYGLQENYLGTGSFGFKIVISPRFKTGQDFQISLIDSDRRPIAYSIDYWGRKLNVKFNVHQETPDGLATCFVSKNNEPVGSFRFWVIK